MTQVLSHLWLLIWQDGSPLSRDYFVRCIKDILSKLGFDSEAYSGHSFRIGAATTCSYGGYPGPHHKNVRYVAFECLPFCTFVLMVKLCRQCLAVWPWFSDIHVNL